MNIDIGDLVDVVDEDGNEDIDGVALTATNAGPFLMLTRDGRTRVVRSGWLLNHYRPETP
jgi:hypothetical protein